MNLDSLSQCFCAIFSGRLMWDWMLEVPGVYWVRSRTLSHFERRQSTCATLKLRNSLLLDSCHIVLDGLMLLEVSLELISVQVRFQLENLPGNLLVLSFDPLQLRLPLIEVQALCSEFNLGNRMAFWEHNATHYRVYVRLLSSRNLNELLQQLLIITLDFSLLYRLFIFVYALLIAEEAFLVVDRVRYSSGLDISVLAPGDARQLRLMDPLRPNIRKLKQLNDEYSLSTVTLLRNYWLLTYLSRGSESLHEHQQRRPWSGDSSWQAYVRGVHADSVNSHLAPRSFGGARDCSILTPSKLIFF